MYASFAISYRPTKMAKSLYKSCRFLYGMYVRVIAALFVCMR